MQNIFQKLNELFSMLTDWLLIVLGCALVAKAALAIDVPVAKYSVIAAGVALAALGFWYRHRRKRHRCKK